MQVVLSKSIVDFDKRCSWHKLISTIHPRGGSVLIIGSALIFTLNVGFRPVAPITPTSAQNLTEIGDRAIFRRL